MSGGEEGTVKYCTPERNGKRVIEEPLANKNYSSGDK